MRGHRCSYDRRRHPDTEDTEYEFQKQWGFGTTNLPGQVVADGQEHMTPGAR
ncbi:MAG: hypothetical protein ACM3ZU_12450 [Bacteroidota bacterium]